MGTAGVLPSVLTRALMALLPQHKSTPDKCGLWGKAGNGSGAGLGKGKAGGVRGLALRRGQGAGQGGHRVRVLGCDGTCSHVLNGLAGHEGQLADTSREGEVGTLPRAEHAQTHHPQGHFWPLLWGRLGHSTVSTPGKPWDVLCVPRTCWHRVALCGWERWLGRSSPPGRCREDGKHDRQHCLHPAPRTFS